MSAGLNSRHTFLFPFKWEWPAQENGNYRKKAESEQRAQLEAQLTKSSWQSTLKGTNAQDPSPAQEFNTISYFLDFVRPAVFDLSQKEGKLVSRFTYSMPIEEPKYQIWTEKGNAGPDLSLQVDLLTLEIYPNQVALLGIHLSNYTHAEDQEILRINQFGRRLYPPFLPPSASQAAGELAYKVAFNWDSYLSDDFSYYESSAEKVALPKPPRFITGLLPNGVKVDPTIDDRMFVICWYGNNKLAEEMKPLAQGVSWSSKDKTHNWWYRYVFVDVSEPTVSHEPSFQRYLDESTYLRWAGKGTLFGLTRYSLMALADEEFFGAQILPNHVRDHYYHLAKLVLIQRASLLRFSDQLTQYAEKAHEGEPPIEAIKDWHSNYQFFLNRLNFTQITAQDQGIELYQMMRKAIDLERDEQALKDEIAGLNEYAQAYVEERRSEALGIFTVLGLVFTFYSFLNAFHGAEYWQPYIKAMGLAYPLLLGSMFLIAIAFVMVRVLRTSLLRRQFIRQKWLYLLVLILILFFSLTPLFFS